METKPVQKNGEAAKEVVTLLVNTPEAFKEVVYHFGMLMAPHVAAKLAGVTNQRIQNLIRQGKFTRIVVFGGVHISQIEFEKWNSSPRKAGRPLWATSRWICRPSIWMPASSFKSSLAASNPSRAAARLANRTKPGEVPSIKPKASSSGQRPC